MPTASHRRARAQRYLPRPAAAVVTQRSGVGAAWVWEVDRDDWLAQLVVPGVSRRAALVDAVDSLRAHIPWWRVLRVAVPGPVAAAELTTARRWRRISFHVDQTATDRAAHRLVKDPIVVDVMRRNVRIACDGSYNSEVGLGAWCYGPEDGKEVAGIMGGDSQLCEIQAAVEALRSQPPGAVVELITDSRTVVDGILHLNRHGRMPDWAQLRKRAYAEAWREMRTLVSERRVAPAWVRGHNAHDLQCRVDRGARRALRSRVAAAVLA